jgi:hypothetical protein
MFGFEGNYAGYERLQAVWYDLETMSYYQFCYEIKDSEKIINIYFMPITLGSACMWIEYSDITVAIFEGECVKISLDSVPSDYETNIKDIQKEYLSNSNHKQESNEINNAIRRIMKRFNYNISLKDENEERYDVNSLDLICLDGSVRHFLGNDLFKFKQMAMPKKIALNWCRNKSDYNVYIWFDCKHTIGLFDERYKKSNNTGLNFVIIINNNGIVDEIYCFDQTDECLVKLPKKSYQILAFRNGFEEYRSENYNQPSGSWIW